MEQNPLLKKRYLDFIKTVVKKQKVYSIDNAEGIASAEAMTTDVEGGNTRTMIFFWSEKRLAQAQCKAEWADYNPTEITLSEFLENYCVGLHTDGHIIGCNFDSNLIGAEVEPLQLALDSVIKLRKGGSNLKLSRYEDIQIFEELVREHLKDVS